MGGPAQQYGRLERLSRSCAASRTSDRRRGAAFRHGRAPLRGRHGRREDARLDRSGRRCAASRRGDGRAARVAASGACIRLHACKQHALLEQTTVEGALCSEASCAVVVRVEAGRVPGEGEEDGITADETRPRAGLRKRRSVLAASEVPQSTGAAILGSTDEPPAAQVPPPPRDPEAMGRDHPLPFQRIADTFRAATK